MQSPLTQVWRYEELHGVDTVGGPGCHVVQVGEATLKRGGRSTWYWQLADKVGSPGTAGIPRVNCHQRRLHVFTDSSDHASAWITMVPLTEQELKDKVIQRLIISKLIDFNGRWAP